METVELAVYRLNRDEEEKKIDRDERENKRAEHNQLEKRINDGGTEGRAGVGMRERRIVLVDTQFDGCRLQAAWRYESEAAFK